MNRSSSWLAVLPSLVIPICLGLSMYIGVLALIQHDIINNETVLRYLTGHPVSKISLGMFLIGLASLMLIAWNVFEQFGAAKKIRIDRFLSEAEPNEMAEDDQAFSAAGTRSIEKSQVELNIEKAVACCQSLKDHPRWMHHHYLWQRILNALLSIFRTGSPSVVENELKHLADLDYDQQQQRYSLVRILIWATPMLGFLGTVLGISQALGGINIGPDNDFQQMMDGLRGSLYVAFDTTALALTLSMLLMFGQFLIDRFETQLLGLVDQRAQFEINSHFDLTIDAASIRAGQDEDSVVYASSKIAEAMQESVQEQTKVWRRTVVAAEQAWIASLTDVNSEVQSGLSEALSKSVSDLAHYLGETIDRADQAMATRWGQWQVTLSDNARQLAQQQKHLVEHTDLIHRLLDKLENPTRFHETLQANQNALEETEKLKNSLVELAQESEDSTDESTDSIEKPIQSETLRDRQVQKLADLKPMLRPTVILPFTESSPASNLNSQEKTNSSNVSTKDTTNESSSDGTRTADELKNIIISFPDIAA